MAQDRPIEVSPAGKPAYGLRVRLLVVVLFAVIPAFGVILHSARKQEQVALAEAKRGALKLARDAAEQHRHLVSQARRALSQLAQAPAVKFSDRYDCAAFLAGQLSGYTEYANFGLIDLEGNLVCSAVHFDRPINAADRLYFQKTLKTRDFSIGEYQIGRATGTATINFGYPVVNHNGVLGAVVFAALDLTWLNQLLERSGLPVGSALLLADYKGTALAGFPDPQKWVGKVMPELFLRAGASVGESEHIIEAPGIDGIRRLFGIVPLTTSETVGGYIAVGIPPNFAYAEVRRTARQNILVLGFVSMIALAAAWFGGNFFVVTPVNALIDATRHLKKGDLGARTGLSYRPDEIGQLAHSFDEMAAELYRRQLQLERSKAEVQLNLDRIRALHQIDLAISSTLDLQTVLYVLLESIDVFFAKPNVSAVALLNKRTGELQPVAARNVPIDEWKAKMSTALQDVNNEILERKAPVIIKNVQANPRTREIDSFRNHGLVSYVGLPLVSKDDALGVLSLYTKAEHGFTDEEIEFLATLAGQATIAIHNAQLYEEKNRQTIELEKSNRVKTEFLGVMSHELRTPLTGVLGYTSLMQAEAFGKNTAEQAKAIDMINKRSNDLLSMIQSILHATTIESGAVSVDESEIDIRALLDDLRGVYAISTNGVPLMWDYRSELPIVRTDGGKLKHILENLINNALKFTHEGSVTVSARQLPDTQSIEFTVADTGIGINREMLPFIFEIFRQVDSSDTRLYEGVGLGLYIVKEFTELLGGKVEVESEPGKGSVFRVLIPCDRRSLMGASGSE